MTTNYMYVETQSLSENQQFMRYIIITTSVISNRLVINSNTSNLSTIIVHGMGAPTDPSILGIRVLIFLFYFSNRRDDAFRNKRQKGRKSGLQFCVSYFV